MPKVLLKPLIRPAWPAIIAWCGTDYVQFVATDDGWIVLSGRSWHIFPSSKRLDGISKHFKVSRVEAAEMCLYWRFMRAKIKSFLIRESVEIKMERRVLNNAKAYVIANVCWFMCASAFIHPKIRKLIQNDLNDSAFPPELCVYPVLT